MITESQKKYFANPAHKGVQEFYFTANGAAFFKQNDAQIQAANLAKQGKSNTILHITRAEYDAQMLLEKESAPAPKTGKAQGSK